MYLEFASLTDCLTLLCNTVILLLCLTINSVQKWQFASILYSSIYCIGMLVFSKRVFACVDKTAPIRFYSESCTRWKTTEWQEMSENCIKNTVQQNILSKLTFIRSCTLVVISAKLHYPTYFLLVFYHRTDNNANVFPIFLLIWFNLGSAGGDHFKTTPAFICKNTTVCHKNSLKHF